nr:hypothetical protein [Burkholderia ubonensis]
MEHKRCASCGGLFEPRPQTPHQAYCPSRDCQRARKRQWQREKLRTDPDYRANQREAQRAWLNRNPDYWRQYRLSHPDYVTRSHARQRGQPISVSGGLAKMDVCLAPSGVYRIAPLAGPDGVLVESWLVRITPACKMCPHKMDVCKERT